MKSNFFIDIIYELNRRIKYIFQLYFAYSTQLYNFFRVLLSWQPIEIKQRTDFTVFSISRVDFSTKNQNSNKLLLIRNFSLVETPMHEQLKTLDACIEVGGQAEAYTKLFQRTPRAR